MTAEIAVAVLLGLVGGAALLSVVGLLRSPTPLAALHYLGPAAIAAPPLLVAAVVVSGETSLAFDLQAGLVAAFLVVGAPFVTQLLGRAYYAGENEGGESG